MLFVLLFTNVSQLFEGGEKGYKKQPELILRHGRYIQRLNMV